jgi:hypothetical protein
MTKIGFTTTILKNALILIISAFSFTLYASTTLELKRDLWLSDQEQLAKFTDLPQMNLEDYKNKNLLLISEYKNRGEYLRELGVQYLNGKIESSNLDSDFKSFSNYQKIMGQFSVELLQLSIQKLQKSKIPEIKKLMVKYNSIYTNAAIPLFRITGSEIQRESPTEEKGGFHRGQKSIFMDITRTSNREWLFIFSHELFHALDSELYEASAYFSNQDNFKEILKMSDQYENLVELRSYQMSKLDAWVMAGLNRGLFAEWRAWNFGLAVYSEGFMENLWGKIPFLESVLSFKSKNENTSTFIYRYLNERAKLSDEGVLGRTIIKEKIQEQRDQFDPTKA